MTRRREIIRLLEQETFSAQQLTNRFACEMWEIIADLNAIAQSVYPRLKRNHAYCNQCGFVFKERSRLKTPSRCPECKSHAIVPPTFFIEREN